MKKPIIIFILLINGAMLFADVEQSKPLCRDDVRSIVKRVADWQLAHPHDRPSGSWVQGPFWNGLMAIGKLPGNNSYIDKVARIGAQQKWQVISTTCPPNDHATPQAWLEMYELYQERSMLDPTRKALDEIMAITKDQDHNLEFKKENFYKWSWCDALYMSPPTFARLAKITGQQKYLDYLHKWWWLASDFYYDREECLYFRDQNFFSKRGPNGKKIFWGRGNGWVVGGLVRVLQYLPKDEPVRPRYEKQLKDMCEKLLTLQNPDGLWGADLLDPDNPAGPETSGSGLIIYGLAYAVNEAIIDGGKYTPAVKKAWVALTKLVDRDGRLTFVQPPADSPKAFKSDTTLPYGAGAFLLAGSEVYRMVSLAGDLSNKKSSVEVKPGRCVNGKCYIGKGI